MERNLGYKMAPLNLGLMASLSAAFCWGIATVMSKVALAVFPPAFLLFTQLSVSVLFLWILIAVLKIKPAYWRDVLKFGSLGLLEPFIAYFLGLTGLADIDASSATLIQSTEAIMIVILSVVLFKNRVSWKFYFLSVLGLIGIFIVLNVKADPQNIVSQSNPAGSLFVILGTAVAVFYVVLSSRFVFQVSPILIVAWQQTIALICVTLSLLPELGTTIGFMSVQLSAQMWLLAVVSGIVQYALAFTLYLAAMKTVNTVVVGNMLNMVPVFGLFAAFIF